MKTKEKIRDLTYLQIRALDVIRSRTSTCPITGKDLANAIGLKKRVSGKEGADMRQIINALRDKSYPICANTRGYFYPRSSRELSEYINSLQLRVNEMQKSIEGLRNIKSWGRIEVSIVPEYEEKTRKLI